MRRLAALLLLSALLTGCGPRPPQPATLVRPSSAATLTFIYPVPGQVVTGRMLHVRLELKGGRIIPETSPHLTPDRGHIHLSLDGRVVSMAWGVEQNVAVTPGDHILQAEFVATDHFPFNPRIVTTVTITVK